MKRTIKLTESQFSQFIDETCRKILSEDMAYMSDEDIANQYSDMKITYFEINPLRNSEGWEGTFELEFPNADDIDYDSTMVNDFFVYDSEGNRIAWDNWMPDEQTNYLNDIIRKEIAKRSVKESINRRLNEDAFNERESLTDEVRNFNESLNDTMATLDRITPLATDDEIKRRLKVILHVLRQAGEEMRDVTQLIMSNR